MSKSPKQVAIHALAAARDGLPPYSAVRSPKKFTQHQLFALAVLRQFFRTDYRGIVAIVADSSDLRRVLGLKAVPHYSTLAYAEKRFSQGGIRLPAAGYGADCSLDRPAA
jgi:hypothetical protein